MAGSKSEELLGRLRAGQDDGEGKITLSVERSIVPVLERYRKRVSVQGNRSRRQSYGEVAQELIIAADELLRQQLDGSSTH